MHAQKNSGATGLVTFLPIVFGVIGLILCGIYQAQRSGVFLHSSYSFDRFIQHHLGIAFFGSLAAVLGVVAGLLILRICGRSRLVTVGTIISLVALLYSVFGLSL
jgi:hypothetical protein